MARERADDQSRRCDGTPPGHKLDRAYTIASPERCEHVPHEHFEAFASRIQGTGGENSRSRRNPALRQHERHGETRYYEQRGNLV